MEGAGEREIQIQTKDKTKTQNGVRFFMLLHAFQTRDRSNIITRNTFTGTDVMGELASWKKKTRSERVRFSFRGEKNS